MAKTSVGVVMDLLGDNESLKRTLAESEVTIKRFAERIGKIKAEVEVKVKMPDDARGGQDEKAQKAAESIAKKTIDAQEKVQRQSVPRQERISEAVGEAMARGEERGRRRASTRQAKDPGGSRNLFERIASSSGTDPFLNSLAKSGPAVVGGIIAAKAVGSILRIQNIARSQDKATARGDLEGAAAAEKQLNAVKESVPILGQLASAIHERITGEQEYIDALKFATTQQETLNKFLENRASRARAEIDRGESTATALDRREEDRNAPSNAARNTFAVRAILEDELKRQGKLAAIDVDEGTAAGRANRETRDRLGREVSIAAGQESAADRTRRTREFVEEQERIRAEAEKTTDERIERERLIRRSRTIRTLAAIEAIEVQRADQERADKEREGREREISGDRTRRTRENLELGERVTRGEAETRVDELESQGKRKEARIVEIEEQRRRDLADAQGNADLESQANRRAKAELLELQRGLDHTGAPVRAEVVNPFTTDLSGRFSGPIDPAAETPKILKDRIAVALDKIETNTRNTTGATWQ